MDVLPGVRGLAAALLLACTTLSACGNRYDLDTDRGRRARIDDANFHLSKGECSAALASILPLYQSTYVDDEIRLVTASAHACEGTFNLLNLAGGLSSAANPFQGLAKSLSNKPNDGARAAMYRANDVLTKNGTALGASLRSPAANSYMVFIQLGIIGTVIRNYGSPALDGAQGANLVYDVSSNPAGEVSNEDACALAASLGNIVDSFVHSGLVDESIKSFSDQLENICVTNTGQSCSVLSQSRSACDGTNTASIAAQGVVTGINAGW
jgi:hypothetical protein